MGDHQRPWRIVATKGKEMKCRSWVIWLCQTVLFFAYSRFSMTFDQNQRLSSQYYLKKCFGHTQTIWLLYTKYGQYLDNWNFLLDSKDLLYWPLPKLRSNPLVCQTWSRVKISWSFGLVELAYIATKRKVNLAFKCKKNYCLMRKVFL